jgi:cytochrome-b5 reductase
MIELDYLFWIVFVAISYGIITTVNHHRKKSKVISDVPKIQNGFTTIESTTPSIPSKPEVLTNEWAKYRIIAITQVSHNVKLLRFQLPEGQSLGIKLGDHCRIRFMREGKEVAKTYTPCSPATAVGYFEVIFKVYPTGGVSQYMDGQKIGDEVEIRKRPGSLRYTSNEHLHVGLLCGGTGITPMLQFIDHLLHDLNDKTRVTLITANSTCEDVLLEKELEALASEFPERFKLFFAVSRPTPGWTKGYSGRITADFLSKSGLNSNDCNRVLLCGPDTFNAAAKEAMAANGFTPNQIYVF